MGSFSPGSPPAALLLLAAGCGPDPGAGSESASDPELPPLDDFDLDPAEWTVQGGELFEAEDGLPLRVRGGDSVELRLNRSLDLRFATDLWLELRGVPGTGFSARVRPTPGEGGDAPWAGLGEHPTDPDWRALWIQLPGHLPVDAGGLALELAGLADVPFPGANLFAEAAAEEPRFDLEAKRRSASVTQGGWHPIRHLRDGGLRRARGQPRGLARGARSAGAAPRAHRGRGDPARAREAGLRRG